MVKIIQFNHIYYSLYEGEDELLDIKSILNKNPIIATAKINNLKEALTSNASAILLINSSIDELIEANIESINKIKPVFIHIDLIKGLSSDKEAVKFIKNYVKPIGIISTKSSIIRAAVKLNFIVVQRIFLIDTKSLMNSLQSIEENNPNAIEIMPGIAPNIINTIKKKTNKPIILGGLISKREHIEESLSNGADGVSLSNSKLWNLKLK